MFIVLSNSTIVRNRVFEALNKKIATWIKKILSFVTLKASLPLLIGVRGIIRGGNLINARFLVQWLSALESDRAYGDVQLSPAAIHIFRMDKNSCN